MKRLLLFLLGISGSALGAGKDYVPGFVLIPATSMASNITSDPVDVRGWDNIDVELIASGSPTGTFAVDCSLNQKVPPGTTAQTWVAIPLSPTPAVTGSASNIIIELNQMGCMYLRVRYVDTSGTGTLTAYVGQKQI